MICRSITSLTLEKGSQAEQEFAFLGVCFRYLYACIFADIIVVLHILATWLNQKNIRDCSGAPDSIMRERSLIYLRVQNRSTSG